MVRLPKLDLGLLQSKMIDRCSAYSARSLQDYSAAFSVGQIRKCFRSPLSAPFTSTKKCCHRNKTAPELTRNPGALLHQSAPAPCIDQEVAIVPGPMPEDTVVPFMNQIAASPLVSIHRMSLIPSTSVGVGALDGPDARRHGADVRGGGVQDRGAVHLPDRHVAGRVAPENVALAVAVKVAG